MTDLKPAAAGACQRHNSGGQPALIGNAWSVQFAEIESATESHGTAKIRRESVAPRWQIPGAPSRRRYALARPNLSA